MCACGEAQGTGHKAQGTGDRLLSAPRVSILVRPNDDIGFAMISLIWSRAALARKSQCVMSSAPPDEINTQFSALFSP